LLYSVTLINQKRLFDLSPTAVRLTSPSSHSSVLSVQQERDSFTSVSRMPTNDSDLDTSEKTGRALAGRKFEGCAIHDGEMNGYFCSDACLEEIRFVRVVDYGFRRKAMRGSSSTVFRRSASEPVYRQPRSRDRTGWITGSINRLRRSNLRSTSTASSGCNIRTEATKRSPPISTSGFDIAWMFLSQSELRENG
jgi:hypothetical protein